MILLKNVTKVYAPSVHAVKNITLHVGAGEFVFIVGQSGTGKTTIIKLVTAEEPVTSGSIEIGGWNITRIKHREVPVLRRQIGVIFQDFKLLPKKTVFENVAFALEVAGEPVAKINKIVPQLLRVVDIEDKAHRFPHQISGGEKQRVAIARSLAHKPKLIIADEPTGNLDSINARGIIELLKKINNLGTTILMVTHDREIVNSQKMRVVTLDEGTIVNDQRIGRYIL
ncbi:MAG: Cell division ATP-binding protein FtsE [Parcubacteria group bacterium GW2011_GWA2_44_12]|nr:MAG: Cell division ATP-binding protein FtsE [Parcubacteria group bacterium GW2011_GWA2_44_12]